MKHRRLLTTLFLVANSIATAAPLPRPARVAIFVQPGFPSYGISALLNPTRVAEDLRTAGLAVEFLDTDALANPSTFNTDRYDALILPYGNTYPDEAFPNLRRFHQAKGSLITTGIPFTHPAARLSAKHWEATPGWGSAVQLAPPKALRITVESGDWTGVSSARFPVQSGDAVQISLTAQTLRLAQTSNPAQKNTLYLRFFDANGKYLSQEGTTLAPPQQTWQRFTVQAKAPQSAARADLSVQLQRTGTRVLVSGIAARCNDKSVALANADLAQRGDLFLDLGHRDAPAQWGKDGIGIGGFSGPGKPGDAPATVAAGDPLKLSGLITESKNPLPPPQWLSPSSVPAGARIVPVIGDAAHPRAALIVHESDAFRGAVDLWTYRALSGDREEFDTRQLLTRGTVVALERRGVLSQPQQQSAIRKLDALPRPVVYANQVLPTVPRRYTTFQPKMPPPARQLYVADVRRLSAEEKLLLISLQGVVNRVQPRIYLLFDDDDQRWLDELQRQNATDTPIRVSDPFTLLATFKSSYNGAVVCDPKVYTSPCLAASLAGTQDLVIAKTKALADRLKLPIRVDLRGRFRTNADALHYLRTEVAPKLDPYLTCSLDPKVFDRGGLDQLIAARGSVFWITGPKGQSLPGANQLHEMEELRAYFATLPLGAVVRGFWWNGDGMGLQEDDGVALGGRFGKVTLVSDLITNLSVHSGVPATTLTQKPRPEAPKLDPKKVYLSFTMSDGDNLCTWRGYFRRYFDDPLRGTIPIGWGMSPAIIDLAPSWARWYYEKATPNDEFICDVSGVAYMYPSSWGTALKDRSAAFDFFYGRTQEYMDRMDMKTIRLMDVRAEDIARVGPLLPTTAFLFPDYGHAGGEKYSELTYSLPSGQAVFRAITSGSGPENLARQIRQRASGARPAFVNAFIWNWGSNLSDLKKVLELLGSDYVAVTPSQLNTLYREASGKN